MGSFQESLQEQTFDCRVCVPLAMLPSVRELQQDMREPNQADLPEVDPEENSAEFMGILIKVRYLN